MKNTGLKDVLAPTLMMSMSRQCSFCPQSIVFIDTLVTSLLRFLVYYFTCRVKYSCLAVKEKELLV